MLRRVGFGWAFTLLLLPAMARAGTITIEYRITGGTATGAFLAGQALHSGRAVVTFPVPGSNPYTFVIVSAPYFSIDLYLRGTGGATYQQRFPGGFIPAYTAGLLVAYPAPFGFVQAQWSYDYHYGDSDYSRANRREVFLDANPLASLVGSFAYSTRTRRSAETFLRTGGATFVGREVMVPEPEPVSLLATGLLLVAAALGFRQCRARSPLGVHWATRAVSLAPCDDARRVRAHAWTVARRRPTRG